MTTPDSPYQFMYNDDFVHPRDDKDDNTENDQAYAVAAPPTPQPAYFNFDMMDAKGGSNRSLNEDDMSVYSETEVDMGELRGDLEWSMLSNVLFVGGSLGYLILSIWDFIAVPEFAFTFIIYHVVEASGPVVYMMNSAVDVFWANLVRSKEKAQRQLSNRQLMSETSAMGTRKKRKISAKRQLNKIRKHAAHRRGLLAALFFGFAAFFAVVDLVVYYFGNYNNTMIPGSDRAIFDALSVHVYLLSAICAVTGRRTRPRTCSFSIANPDNLEDLGDLFFLIGSLVDVTLCDFHFDDHAPLWSIVSSVLWFVDACFYLRSDFVTQGVYDEVSLLQLSGNLGTAASGSARSMILMNRLAKASGDKNADGRLATFISQDNGTLV